MKTTCVTCDRCQARLEIPSGDAGEHGWTKSGNEDFCKACTDSLGTKSNWHPGNPLRSCRSNNLKVLPPTEEVKDQWKQRVMAVRNSKKPSVRNMTFAQLDVTFARSHGWWYAPPGIPYMPACSAAWLAPVREIPLEELISVPKEVIDAERARCAK